MIARAADVSHAPAAGTKKMRGADGGDDAEGGGERAEGGGDACDGQVPPREESLRRLSKLHVSD